MPLAGRVRLKTFLLGVGGVVVVGILGVGGLVSTGVIGTGWLVSQAVKSTPSPRPTPTPSPPPTPSVRPDPSPAPAPGTAAHTVAMSYQGTDLKVPKRKDVTSGRPFKINVYQDEGNATANRLKIDLDRDDAWDEKWTFTDGGVTRVVAPDDDEVYGDLQTWDGSVWRGEAEEVPSPAPDAAMSPVESAAMAYQGRDLGTKKLKDVTKGKPYKINVYQDEGNATANRLKIDHDRDDAWDEKWTFHGDGVSRKVASADDESYDVEQRWTGAAWE